MFTFSLMSYVHAQGAQTPQSSQRNAGITLDNTCLTNGTCRLDIYQTLGIREDSPENSTQIFVQDAILGATFFIGTVATIGMIIAGMMTVFAWADEGMYAKGKKGFLYSIIGLLLSIFSYTLIRFIQYIAQGNQ